MIFRVAYMYMRGTDNIWHHVSPFIDVNEREYNTRGQQMAEYLQKPDHSFPKLFSIPALTRDRARIFYSPTVDSSATTNQDHPTESIPHTSKPFVVLPPFQANLQTPARRRLPPPPSSPPPTRTPFIRSPTNLFDKSSRLIGLTT